MKTLIVYYSKTGVTEDCAKELSKLIKGETELVNIKNKDKLNFDDYNSIVIGTSIYAGNINGKIKKLCTQNRDILMNKPLGIFTCGLSTDSEALTFLEKGIGVGLIQHAKVIAHFRGELRMDKLNFLFRFIIKKVMESKGGKQTDFKIDRDKIKEFSDIIAK